MLKYKYIFEIQHTEAILSNSTRKLLRYEITKMLIAVCEKKIIVSFIMTCGTLSFAVAHFVTLLTAIQAVARKNTISADTSIYRLVAGIDLATVSIQLVK